MLQLYVSDSEEQQSAKVKMKSNIYIYIDTCFIIKQTRISYDFHFKKKSTVFGVNESDK